VVRRCDRNDVDLLALEHPSQIGVTLRVDAAVLQLLLRLSECGRIDLAQTHDARALHLREPSHMVLSAASTADDAHTNILSGTEHLRP
jgi:hypothetical protein